MKKRENLINGQKPEFGNDEQIRFMLYHERIVKGEDPINSFQFYLPDSHLESQKIFIQFDCYDCKSVNKFEYDYDVHNHYHTLISAQTNFKNQCRCKNCKHKYYYDDEEFGGGLYYRKPKE